MFTFAYGIEDTIEWQGERYELHMAYDTVLRFFDVWADGSLTEHTRFTFALQLFFGKNTPLLGLPVEEQLQILQGVIQTCVLVEKPSVVKATLEKEDVTNEKKECYSLTEDADIVFASFYFDYGIDLLEQRGKLHWAKFKALLNNLSEESKLAQVIRIRQWEPNEQTTLEEKRQMKRLQKYYALGVSQKDAEELMYFNSLSGEEKEAFARKRLAELEGGGIHG